MEGGFMRRTSLYAIGIILALLALQSCSSKPEEGLLQKYFNAVKLKDMATMSSMAVDPVNVQVDSWKIISISPETTETTTLADMGKNEVELKKKLEGHVGPTMDAENALYDAKEKYNSARSGAAKASAKKEMDDAQVNYDKERELHRQIQKEYNDAVAASRKEEDTTLFSLGTNQLPNVRDLTGQVFSKDVQVEVKSSDGTLHNYKLALKRYELKDEAAGISHRGRWVIIKFETLN
jgi:hypothetical protein